ncbi:glycosyltransferase family 25 protein [Asaia sp. VD9]|uniref:glycosyltransferase family 25 protein n=1 Tax=Asaia sp. VD9 TaxID=3081235 RepID=UPI00301913E2
MDKFFISLERTPERTERFIAANSHINGLVHAPGIDGKSLNRDAVTDAGLVHPACRFTVGAIGSGLTHIALWGSIAKNRRPAHIFEDDAYLCKNFEAESERIIAGLDEEWEIILWGNNPDTTLKFALFPDITPCVMRLSQQSVQKNIDRFAQQEVAALAFRLDHTFGICGYAVSPKGAQTLLKGCLPLRGEAVCYDSLGGKTIIASSVDHLMNTIYPQIQAYVSFPPLCLTDNRAEHSLNA